MYCTQDDLIRRFGEDELIDLTDRSASGQVDANTIAEAITDAAAIMDSYLQPRYRGRMPFSPVPAVLERIACNLVRYYLYTNHKPDEVAKPYDEALKFLESVASGRVSIGSSEEEAPTTGGLPEMQSDGRTFGRSDQGFI